jgi:hypothetical protein
VKNKNEAFRFIFVLVNLRPGVFFLFLRLASPPGLHLQIPFTEGVEAAFEMETGKFVAVTQTVFHLSLHRAIEDRTNPADQPQLGDQLSVGLSRQSGAAGAAFPFGEEPTGQAVDAAGPGTFHFLPPWSARVCGLEKNKGC